MKTHEDPFAKNACICFERVLNFLQSRFFFSVGMDNSSGGVYQHSYVQEILAFTHYLFCRSFPDSEEIVIDMS